jgi:hypothetical protein
MLDFPAYVKKNGGPQQSKLSPFIPFTGLKGLGKLNGSSTHKHQNCWNISGARIGGKL